MKKKMFVYIAIPTGLLILFILYTISIMFIDVKPIGPKGSLVGFATINRSIHNLFGVNMKLYNITEWLSLIPLFIAIGFAVLGLIQLIKQKRVMRIDSSILLLGGFYLLVISAYLIFEFNVVNYRPILMNGVLEASYPSSTTLLVMCIIPTAMMQFNRLIKCKTTRFAINALCGIFATFMVLCRLISGVHWVTDIFGGILLSAALVLLYFSANQIINPKMIRNEG